MIELQQAPQGAAICLAGTRPWNEAGPDGLGATGEGQQMRLPEARGWMQGELAVADDPWHARDLRPSSVPNVRSRLEAMNAGPSTLSAGAWLPGVDF
jgi:hypothetical protein